MNSRAFPNSTRTDLNDAVFKRDSKPHWLERTDPDVTYAFGLGLVRVGHFACSFVLQYANCE